MADGAELEGDLIAKLKQLDESLWEGRCNEIDISRWLANFTGLVADRETERLHALFLLSKLTFFGSREIRVMLQSMYRDLFRYPVTRALREAAANTRDPDQIDSLFRTEVKNTRFLGMGNPAESGTHLLYYFRQENQLHKDLFIGQHQILNSSARAPDVDFREPGVTRYVFVDDVCGSGQQSVAYSNTLLTDLKQIAFANGRTVEFHYLVLFATDVGLSVARDRTKFDSVAAVHTLDKSYRTFSADSRVYKNSPDLIDKSQAEAIFRAYGSQLAPNFPLGYGNNQLLLAFSHNIPDNTLPVIWYDEDPSKWTAILPRYPKIGA